MRFVWRSLSQDDLEEFMRVSVGPGGDKLDKRSTQFKIARRCMFTAMMLGPENNLVAQPVQRKGAYARDDKKRVDRWNSDERMPPPLGTFSVGEVKLERVAKKSAEGKPMFRGSVFRRRQFAGSVVRQ